MVFTSEQEKGMAIAQALLYDKTIKILYKNDKKGGEITLREVFPLHVQDDERNLLTVCSLRRDYRKFEIAHIVGVQPC